MLFRAFCCLLFLLVPAAPCLSFNLSLGPAHYAEAMETYYTSPRPEIISPLLRSFAQAHLLANPNKRLFVAAFLSELIKKNCLDLPRLLKEARELGRDARLTVAWSLHLAGRDHSALLANEDARFADQIRKTPARLEAWDPAWESSVLGMYWAAFMASGSKSWIDRIIACALATRSASNPAAASLYDYAPRHPLVAGQVEKRMAGATGSEKEILHLILQAARK